MYTQVKAFDKSKGGDKPLYCLQNVRLGFGIASLYDNATQAWHNTERHRDRNIPKGVDVPLYYSFTTSNGKEGHINVQLANGKVWSDGKIYANLAAYEAASSPVYLGWGESVNNVRVIKEGSNDMPTEQDVKYYFSVYEGNTPTAADIKYFTTHPWRKLADRALLKQGDALKAQIAKQTKIIEAQNKQTELLGIEINELRILHNSTNDKITELEKRPKQADYDRLAGDLAKCLKANEEDVPPPRVGRGWLSGLSNWLKNRRR